MEPDSKLQLIKALENRPNLGANKLCPEYPTFSDLKKGWLSVSQVLNESSKCRNHNWTAFGVRKKWADLKYKTRKKFATLKQMKEEGNYEIPPSMKISPLDKRIMALTKLKNSRKSTLSTSSQNGDGPTRGVKISDVRTEPESPDTNDPALDSSMNVPADRIENGDSMGVSDDRRENNGINRTSTSRFREDAKFKELFSWQKSKMDIRKEELLIKKEKLELKKQEIELRKKQLTVQTKTLNHLKAICKLMEKQEK